MLWNVQPYPDPDLPFGLWWAAYEHEWLIGWIWDGTAPYIPAPFAHQLTTGHHEHCPARYYPDVECAGSWRCIPVSGADVVAAGYLGQVLERIIRNMVACSCEYGLHPTIWNPTHLMEVYGVGTRGAAYTFRIDPFCPHHGKLTAAQGDRLWEIVLTEEETTRHD